MKKNRFTGKIEKNGLFFKRGANFKLLKPLSLGYIDFESCHELLPEDRSSMDQKDHPRTAVAIQTPLSFSLSYASTYKEIPLPPPLQQVRMKFLDKRNGSTVKDFFLNLLLTLRKDLLEHHKHMQGVLSRNSAPPTPAYRPGWIKNIFLKSQFCSLCGKTFFSKRISPR